MTSREVFFDVDSSIPDSGTLIILQELASEIKRTQPKGVIISGYTDRAGSQDYNAKLAVKRAKAVAAALQKEGVPARMIKVAGCGENHAAIPTTDGVKFRENRRVVIRQINDNGTFSKR